MTRDQFRFGLRICSLCGRGVCLNRHGHYRRHFAIPPSGKRYLCAASGRAPEAA